MTAADTRARVRAWWAKTKSARSEYHRNYYRRHRDAINAARRQKYASPAARGRYSTGPLTAVAVRRSPALPVCPARALYQQEKRRRSGLADLRPLILGLCFLLGIIVGGFGAR